MTGLSTRGSSQFSARTPAAPSTHDLDVATIKNITKPIHVLVDHREPPEIVELLRRAPMTTVEVCALELGDYLIDGHLIVERKSVGDFEASIIDDDKRLFTQSERMKHRPELVPILVIEGDVFGRRQRMTAQQITGAITFLGVIQGMSVLTTLDLAHTAYMII